MAEQSGRKDRRRSARRRGALFAHFEAADGMAAEPPALLWRRTMRSRVLVVAAGLALWTVGIEARLIVLQEWQFDTMVARAERQQLRTIDTPAKRGEILDRHGRILALSVDADSIYAVPADIDEPERVARLLCETLDDCDEALHARLVDRLSSDRAFAYVSRQVSPREAARVAALELDGSPLREGGPPFLPPTANSRRISSDTCGIDNQGLNGIEFTYDDQIRGRPGKTLIQTDARRRAFSRVDRPPTIGATLELTIDEYLQHIAERELRAAVELHDADGGTVIIMAPHTGEVLALANEPTFNPNAFAASGADDRRNRAIQDIYEPGSTFKIVTASAALQERVVHPDDPIDVSAGMIRFGSRRIDDDYRYDTLSFTDVIVKSSNVGTIKVALRFVTQRTGWLCRTVRVRQEAVARLPGRKRGQRLEPRSPRRQRPGLGGHRVSGGRDAAPDGDRDQCHREWRRTDGTQGRARDPGGRKALRRAAARHSPSGHRRDERDGHDDDGGRRPAGHRSPRQHSRLLRGRQNRDLGKDCRRPILDQRVQRLIRRIRAIT